MMTRREQKEADAMGDTIFVTMETMKYILDFYAVSNRTMELTHTEPEIRSQYHKKYEAALEILADIYLDGDKEKASENVERSFSSTRQNLDFELLDTLNIEPGHTYNPRVVEFALAIMEALIARTEEV